MDAKTVDNETSARTAAAKHLDDLLDEALDQSYPASDPVAISVALQAIEPNVDSVVAQDDRSTRPI